ncbi:MAG: hypothetical protein ACJ74G_24690 [Blastocatellia bacterium]
MKIVASATLALMLFINTVSCARNHTSATVDSLAASSATVGQHPEAGVSAPSPPAVTLDTTIPRMMGRTIAVHGGANAAAALQAAFDQALPGDMIVLDAGAQFVGNFTLPAKREADGKWLVVRTSAENKLPVGARVSPADAVAMPKLVSPNADATLKTAPAAHHIRLVGIEFTVAPNWAQNHGLVLLGDGGSDQNDLRQVPHDLIIDRCYVHGNATGNLRRGIALNSARTAVIDSYVADCREVGADAQAICGWNGPGPFKIVNNYLEGSGENFMLGGADPSIKDMVPSDVEFRRNTLAKPLAWKVGHPSYAGKHWAVKNLFELKNARRVLVDGNVLENCWLDAQVGFAIQLTPRNQDGAADWSTVEDVTLTNNVVRRSAGGINILGRDDNHPSGQAQRIRIANNLFEEIGGPQWGGNGRFLQISEADTIVVDHNTVLHSGNIITAYGKPSTNFVFTNNLMAHNEYGVIGDGASVGLITLQRYFPNGVFKKNAIAGGRSSSYPPDNFFPASLDDAQFVDRAHRSYGLSATSPYRKAATDGRAIGCDPSALESALPPARAAQGAR